MEKAKAKAAEAKAKAAAIAKEEGAKAAAIAKEKGAEAVAAAKEKGGEAAVAAKEKAGEKLTEGRCSHCTQIVEGLPKCRQCGLSRTQHRSLDESWAEELLDFEEAGLNALPPGCDCPRCEQCGEQPQEALRNSAPRWGDGKMLCAKCLDDPTHGLEHGEQRCVLCDEVQSTEDDCQFPDGSAAICYGCYNADDTEREVQDDFY